MAMTKYKIKGTDIFIRGEHCKEGSEIILEKKETAGIEKFLEKIEDVKGGKE